MVVMEWIDEVDDISPGKMKNVFRVDLKDLRSLMGAQRRLLFCCDLGSVLYVKSSNWRKWILCTIGMPKKKKKSNRPLPI